MSDSRKRPTTHFTPTVLHPEDAFPDVEFPLNCREVHQYFTHPASHKHSGFIELVLITGGRGMHSVGDFRHPIGVGDLLIIPTGVDHWYDTVNDLRYYNILFDPIKLGIPMQALADVPGAGDLMPVEMHSKKIHSFCHFNAETFEHAHIMARELHTTLAKNIPGMKFSALGQLMRLLDFLCRSFVESIQYVHPGNINRLTRLTGELESRFSYPWTVSDMCQMTNLSRPMLFKEFQKVFKTTPMDYLLSVRMRNACIMLTQSTKSIGEIAIDCGFTDSSYFILRFRKRTGMTPRDFRNKAQNEISS